jgi:hypothetical protein
MPPEAEPLGVCPECGADITPGQVLIKYKQDDGETGRFAECFSCDEVVRPK